MDNSFRSMEHQNNNHDAVNKLLGTIIQGSVVQGASNHGMSYSKDTKMQVQNDAKGF